ncbi:hypothetical protein JAO29_02755 [Edaphobacter sp. HDX4]|uniref:hypothetical protein n=1 Tax=Edaphobacter sp. HDX4 TaxID=2794064 RepID=UPI002FE581F5
MRLIRLLRITLVVSVVTMLTQAAFAGRMLGGGDRSADLHELTAKVLVVLGGVQTTLAVLSFLRREIPRWLLLASFAPLIAEVMEFAAGHLHHVAIL